MRNSESLAMPTTAELHAMERAALINYLERGVAAHQDDCASRRAAVRRMSSETGLGLLEIKRLIRYS